MKAICMKISSLAMVVIIVAGCSFSSAVFNQRAYEQSVSLKVDALLLMDKATGPFEWSKPDVDAIKLEFAKAYEYAKGLPHNEETVAQYNIMMDTTKASFFGFLTRWESEGKLGAAFVTNSKAVVSDQFDRIMALESGKE
ncbi:MAG: hypothetical protein M1469_02035 [Bacteroidetes bacterium]|nr:hypothetical protein [Bacteroidota bacterium]